MECSEDAWEIITTLHPASIMSLIAGVQPSSVTEYFKGDNAGAWIDPFVFQGHTPPRSRDKYIQRLSEDYKHDAKALQFAPPSWLKPWEKYQLMSKQ